MPSATMDHQRFIGQKNGLENEVYRYTLDLFTPKMANLCNFKDKNGDEPVDRMEHPIFGQTPICVRKRSHPQLIDET